MDLNWITSPLVLYGLLAAGLGFSLALFISVKREVTSLRLQLHRQQSAYASDLETHRASLEQLRLALLDAERIYSESDNVVQMPHTSMNLNKRSQALRMYRRGQTAQEISEALHLPASEVDLLLKIQSAAAPTPPAQKSGLA